MKAMLAQLDDGSGDTPAAFTPPATAAPAPAPAAAPAAPTAGPARPGTLAAVEAETEIKMTPAEKAKIERAKKLPKDPTEILLDSVVTTPTSYTAWQPSNDPAPAPNNMKAMLKELDGPMFFQRSLLRRSHLRKRFAMVTGVEPAVHVLTQAAHAL